MNSPEITPRVWFVTGCSTGLGRALAERILASGDRLIATARQVESINDLKSDHCHVAALDVTDADAINRVVAEAVTLWGKIDVLVNNAGCGLLGSLEEVSRVQVEQNFAVNFHGPIRLIQTLLPTFRSQRKGHIINISAAAAVANYPGFSIYGAAKAALEMASESLRQELAPLGIKVTIVEPGPFRTDFGARSMQRVESTMADYAGTVGKFSELLGKIHGRQPGDPAKAAAVMVQMVHDGKGPLRLPLGKYLINKIKMKSATTLRELTEWEEVGSATEF